MGEVKVGDIIKDSFGFKHIIENIIQFEGCDIPVIDFNPDDIDPSYDDKVEYHIVDGMDEPVRRNFKDPVWQVIITVSDFYEEDEIDERCKSSLRDDGNLEINGKLYKATGVPWRYATALAEYYNTYHIDDFWPYKANVEPVLPECK